LLVLSLHSLIAVEEFADILHQLLNLVQDGMSTCVPVPVLQEIVLMPKAIRRIAQSQPFVVGDPSFSRGMRLPPALRPLRVLRFPPLRAFPARNAPL
jgi:hypothetical protein